MAQTTLKPAELGGASGTSNEGALTRILVLAPKLNDARLSAHFLVQAGMEAVVCRDVTALCAEVKNGCGAVLLAEEVLIPESLQELAATLEAQPSWSDLPVILITRGGENEPHHRWAALGAVGNVSIIERPVRPGTLVSTSQVALRSRRRQYQVCNLLLERQEMAAKAEQQARIFDTTLSSIADFAYIFDTSGRFLYSNRPFLTLLGLELDGIVGKNFFTLPYPPELAARLHKQIMQVVETGHPVRDETPYTNPEGIVGYYEYIFSPVFGEDGTVVVVAGSTRETSERRRIEQQLRESDRRKDEFLAMLSHELRNPLAAVASAVSLLRDSVDAENMLAVGVIERQSRQLAHIIDDLLDVSRITTGKIRLRKEVVDVAAILDHACETTRPLLDERRHEFTTHYSSEALWVEADPTRAEQIIVNLLGNAAKYTPNGGKISLASAREGQEVLITIRDNGMGIAPERLPEIFQLFSQGKRSIARSEGGLGIGLTIVQKLAELHGGRIDAFSEGPDQGSTFCLRLPAVAAPSASPVFTAKEVKPIARRVLIVDDNVDTALTLGKVLSRAGHQVFLAHGGIEALEQANENKPQAVVLDIGLPGIDGFEVARKLRQTPSSSRALLIALTGYGQDEDRRRAREAGFDHHLVKPVDVKELKRLLSEGFRSSLTPPLN